MAQAERRSTGDHPAQKLAPEFRVDVVNQKKNAPEEIFEAIHMHVSQRWP
jgi:hypothetical protein